MLWGLEPDETLFPLQGVIRDAHKHDHPYIRQMRHIVTEPFGFQNTNIQQLLMQEVACSCMMDKRDRKAVGSTLMS